MLQVRGSLSISFNGSFYWSWQPLVPTSFTIVGHSRVRFNGRVGKRISPYIRFMKVREGWLLIIPCIVTAFSSCPLRAAIIASTIKRLKHSAFRSFYSRYIFIVLVNYSFMKLFFEIFFLIFAIIDYKLTLQKYSSYRNNVILLKIERCTAWFNFI